MARYFLIFLTAAVFAFSYGFVVPFAVSARDTLSVVIGVVYAFFVPLVLYRLFQLLVTRK